MTTYFGHEHYEINILFQFIIGHYWVPTLIVYILYCDIGSSYAPKNNIGTFIWSKRFILKINNNMITRELTWSGNQQ